MQKLNRDPGCRRKCSGQWGSSGRMYSACNVVTGSGLWGRFWVTSEQRNNSINGEIVSDFSRGRWCGSCAVARRRRRRGRRVKKQPFQCLELWSRSEEEEPRLVSVRAEQGKARRVQHNMRIGVMDSRMSWISKKRKKKKLEMLWFRELLIFLVLCTP